ncbi:restriction endonuclease subunit S [Vibrio parahaemolyticus]|uniref:restriction endonuclease subunit S n=1 Tax=Vibrio harveyi group TaxID=717610 RepID=UPI000C86A790|nr:restriction endonuclease subunit S [Vibrio parahaemolyticus]AYO02927.1 restriction endonuclease subunit S [Vibrio parahaemolyticus]EHK0753067.1 restriction endonuclease subunit S [Vibrio parahaemolyticus]EJB8454281.1 restriction endonuclease subunit S [Vibrio parahaemolyticus]MCR9750733.1 restriction endonuclease subunit S [Vibrio parahaemolyticus]MCR9863468.1 restriction endonuclease subunit S [Vibrio parahaemolyticus]
MSNLGFMEKLLDGVDIEWKSLTDIFQLKNGYTPSKSKKEFWESGTVPWFRMDDIRERGNILNEALQKVSESAVKGGKLFPAGSIIIATSATIGEHALVNVPFLANQRFTNLSLKPDYQGVLNNKFIFYYCYILADWCKKNTTKSSFASVDMDGFKKFQFPIPCPDNPEKSLKIQAEIVRILDTFTSLTNELTNELTARKKQYNYYRDKLLSFGDENAEWKTLGDVAVIGTGKHDTRDAIDGGEYIFYARGKVPLKLDTFNFDETAIITAGDGAGVGKVYHYAQGKYALHQRAYRIVPDETLHPRFLYHYISAFFYDYIQKVSVSSSVTSLRRPMFIKFPIPVIPLFEQERIVSILDKFDTLTTSIKGGLPKEIELRRKQYEYYRDLLFSFPKPDATETV